MKNQFRLYLLLLIFSAFGFPGCELFVDEEHCQYETTESKIWTPDQYPAYAPGDTSVTFVFSRDVNLFQRSFKIENVCPLGALGVKVRIIEKGSILPPQPKNYRLLLVEVVSKNEGYVGYSGFYKIRKITGFYRQSSNELKAETIKDLIGLPEDGPRTFFIGVAAVFEKGVFSDRLDIENWAKNNVAKVEFTTNFIKYN
jgi:hypothetical protein